MLGLHCSKGFSLAAVSSRYSLVTGPRLIAVASPVAVPRLWKIGSAVVTHRLRCSAACGSLLDQRSNPCLLHWQADSLPLSHQGSLSAGLLTLGAY